jgi:nucleoporin p58/p45
LNEIKFASEVGEVLQKVSEVGKYIPSAIELVNGKLEEVELGLENDAAAIVSLRDGAAKKGEGEAKCTFRSIDRLKVPRQYQVGHKQNESMGGGVYGSMGLSGWWNNPQILKASSRNTNTQSQTMQLPGEEVDDSGPKSLVELFATRTEDITETTKSNKELLSEIEDFVGGLEDKIRGKERELNDRLNYGTQSGKSLNEKEHQLQLLRYVFGECDRSMYEVAGKVGAIRDDIVGLGIR